MTKMKTNLNKNEKYLLACSYGPDSMALFDMLVKENIYFEVVHVNYHILDQADDDEKGIRDFANKFNIKVHVLETHMPKGVNEEDWARTVRYDYFSEVASKTGIKNVLVAQHIDDFIETYYLQKERGYVSYYGIKEISEYKGAKIIRPFVLKYTKSELMNYVNENNIPYSIDPSNLVPIFKRNKIRLEIINKLSREEKNLILQDILKKNEVLHGFCEEIEKLINNNSIEIEEFYRKFKDDKDFYLMLILLLKHSYVFHEISFKEAQEIKKITSSKTKNWEKILDESHSLYLEYGVLSIKEKLKKYCFELKKNESNKLIKINIKDKNYNLIKDCFPLLIKPVNKEEKYFKDGKTYSVNRQFISWKVPLSLRSIWPGIYDKNGNLLYVPKFEKAKERSKGLITFDLEKLCKS